MYLLKHLPPHLQKRWNDQLALQHDVDIKRLWRRSPQTMDTVVGNPPLDLNMTFPEEQFSSSSGAGSSSSAPASSSASSSSFSDYPECVTVTMSGVSGPPCCDYLSSILMTFNRTRGEDLVEYASCPHDPCEIESGDIGNYVVAAAVYSRSSETWAVEIGISGGVVSASYRTDPIGAFPSGDVATQEFEEEGLACTLPDTLTITAGGSCVCPDLSSSGASSSGASSSGPGSSSADSSSDPGSGSGSGSSGSGSSGSGGGGSGSAPDDSSSSFGSAGYSWEGSASSGGDQDSGRGSDFGGEFDCYTVQCAIWEWQGSGWRRTFYAFIACPEVCRTDCSERPQQAGYVGLKARVTCDGTIYYYED